MSTRRPQHPRRRSRIVMVAVLVAFINLPIMHSTGTRWQVERTGVDATLEVAEAEILTPENGANYWVAFRYPDGVDKEKALWPAEVDRATYEEAERTGEIGVRYLPGRVSAYQVDGEVRQRTGLIFTLVADLILLVIALLVWRFGGRRRPLPMRVSAVGDVERCPPGGLWEQVEGDLYLVRGEVSAIDDDEIMLDLGDQDVLVILDGHQNPVGYQQPAQVRARLVT